MGDGTFDTSGYMTRAMAAAIIANLDNSTDEVENVLNFNDVDEEDWFAPYVQWATRKNIVMGVGNGLFEPERPITHEEFNILLTNYINYKQNNTMNNIGNTIGGLTQKSENTYEDNNVLVSRAESAQVIENLLTKFVYEETANMVR